MRGSGSPEIVGGAQRIEGDGTLDLGQCVGRARGMDERIGIARDTVCVMRAEFFCELQCNHAFIDIPEIKLGHAEFTEAGCQRGIGDDRLIGEILGKLQQLAVAARRQQLLGQKSMRQAAERRGKMAAVLKRLAESLSGPADIGKG